MNFSRLGKSGVPFPALGCRTRCRLAAGVGLLLLCGCARPAFDEARQLVERYNALVSEAYRRGDIKLVDSVVGPNEGRKLTGLIGVRLDFGLTLDSQLLALEILGVEKSAAGMRVRTQERWSYRDLKIGTGEQLGQVATDSYAMVYLFIRTNQQWLVDEIQFAAPPQVSRQQPAWIADRAQLPGVKHAAPEGYAP